MRNSRNRRRKRYHVNYKRISLIVLLLIVATIATIFGIKAITNNNNVEVGNQNSGSQVQEIEKPKDITINLVATGDIMCHSTNFKAAYNSETKKYDFTSVFANVAKYITKADIAIRKS